MADWLSGYSSGWDAMMVDPETWADSGILKGVLSVSVDRDGTDSVPLLETGTMQVDGDFSWGWLRIRMTAEQGGAERAPMATLLFEQSRESTEKGKVTEVRGRSVLQPAADVVMPRGGFVPAGADGAAWVAARLRECTPAPVHVEGSFTLSEDVVFDLGCTVLKACWDVLNAAGWCMQIDGMGEIWVRPMPSEPSLGLDRAHAGILVPGAQSDRSLIDIPNRFIAVLDGEQAVAENASGSEASYADRGRWVEKVETSPVLVDGEDLQAYAERRLREESTVTRTYSYVREFWPDVTPFSVVRATLAENGLEGDLRVRRQSLLCGRGVTVSEESGLEVSLWT